MFCMIIVADILSQILLQICGEIIIGRYCFGADIAGDMMLQILLLICCDIVLQILLQIWLMILLLAEWW